MTKEERQKLDAFFNERQKHETAFVKEDGMFEANEHGVYIYTSANGYSSMDLIAVLRSYRDYLIDNKIVKEL